MDDFEITMIPPLISKVRAEYKFEITFRVLSNVFYLAIWSEWTQDKPCKAYASNEVVYDNAVISRRCLNGVPGDDGCIGDFQKACCKNFKTFKSNFQLQDTTTQIGIRFTKMVLAEGDCV